jgi:hypothetical protein
MSQTTIKFNYNDTLKILCIPTTQVNYAHLVETLARIYDLQPSQISSLQLSSKEKLPISNEQQLQHVSETENFIYCSYFAPNASNNGQVIVNNNDNHVRPKGRMMKDDRIVMKYSRMKIYEKFDIKDAAQIEKYKKQLIDLHYMGYKRFTFNLKMLLQYGKNDDFTEAVKQIQIMEEQRFKKNKERREGREKNNWKKKKEIYKDNCFDKKDSDCDMMQGDEEYNNNDAYEDNDSNMYSDDKKSEDYSSDKIIDWPVDKYSTLYVDGNNMLFLNNTLRQNTLRRKKKKSEKIITYAVEQFCNIHRFDLVIVIYDSTNLVYEKVLANGTKLVVTTAIPQFKTSDDALVDFNEKQSPEVRKKSLIATSDRELTQRLTNLGADVMKSKSFLSAICKAVNSSIGLSEWFKNIDSIVM